MKKIKKQVGILQSGHKAIAKTEKQKIDDFKQFLIYSKLL